MCDAAQTRRCTEVNLQAASKPPAMTLTPINDQDQVLAQLRAELCDVRRELAACDQVDILVVDHGFQPGRERDCFVARVCLQRRWNRWVGQGAIGRIRIINSSLKR